MAAVCTNIVNVSPPEKQAESKISKEQVLKAIHELKTLKTTKIAAALNISKIEAAEILNTLTREELMTQLSICPSCKRFQTIEHTQFQYKDYLEVTVEASTIAEKEIIHHNFLGRAIVCLDESDDGTRIKNVNSNVNGDVPRLKPKASDDPKQQQKNKF